MGNIKNYNFNKLDLKLSDSDYWDFYLANDNSSVPYSGVSSGTCLVSYFDFNNPLIYTTTGSTSGNTIVSLLSWSGATNSGYTLNTIGLTGIDNGLVTFDKLIGDTSNIALLSALTGSTLVIQSGDTRLYLKQVTGTTGNFIYPIDIITTGGSVGTYASFCGGGYQGFYKLDGTTYEVLPTRPNYAWAAEFWLNPNDTLCSGYTGTTLNDIYPNNAGIFFYMGTRAENKFWNVFGGADSGCTSGCTQSSGCSDTVSEWCTIPKETDIILSGSTNIGIPLYPPLITIDLITNGFLIYGRAALSGSSGCHTCDGPDDNLGNQTACSFSGFTEPETSLDYNADIVDNALAFIIKNDGSIGYRLLTYSATCITNDISGSTYLSGAVVEEAYSLSGMVSANTWSNIIIRFVSREYLDDCDLKIANPRVGRLLFYVNGKLKFVVPNFKEFIARRLNENTLKQVGVAYNFSLGMGTQGL